MWHPRPRPNSAEYARHNQARGDNEYDNPHWHRSDEINQSTRQSSQKPRCISLDPRRQVYRNPSPSRISSHAAEFSDVPHPFKLASAQVPRRGQESAHVASSFSIHVDLPQSLLAATNLYHISRVKIQLETISSAEAIKAPKRGPALLVHKEARDARPAPPRYSQYSNPAQPNQHPQRAKLNPRMQQRLTVVPAHDNYTRSASPEPPQYNQPAPPSSHRQYTNLNQPIQQNPQAVSTRADSRFVTHSLPQQLPSGGLAQGSSKKRQLGPSAPHFPAASRGYQAEQVTNKQAGVQLWQPINPPQSEPQEGAAPYIKPTTLLRKDAAAHQMQSDNTCESFEDEDWHEAEECFSDCSTDSDDDTPANQGGPCGPHSVGRVSRKTRNNRITKHRKKIRDA